VPHGRFLLFGNRVVTAIWQVRGASGEGGEVYSTSNKFGISDDDCYDRDRQKSRRGERFVLALLRFLEPQQFSRHGG